MSPQCKVEYRCHASRKRGIQYAAAVELGTAVSGILDRPVKPGDDSVGWVGAVALRRRGCRGFVFRVHPEQIGLGRHREML
ncbi:hypothetical protein BraRD5C2_28940 [Bradyrhizobium sp. RD5-C2]|nr:hypothetical protein BraRD5C2_28940 [Bradyrhizobium sp. RD5-C2]